MTINYEVKMKCCQLYLCNHDFERSHVETKSFEYIYIESYILRMFCYLQSDGDPWMNFCISLEWMKYKHAINHVKHDFTLLVLKFYHTFQIK